MCKFDIEYKFKAIWIITEYHDQNLIIAWSNMWIVSTLHDENVFKYLSNIWVQIKHIHVVSWFVRLQMFLIDTPSNGLSNKGQSIDNPCFLGIWLDILPGYEYFWNYVLHSHGLKLLLFFRENILQLIFTIMIAIFASIEIKN